MVCRMRNKGFLFFFLKEKEPKRILPRNVVSRYRKEARKEAAGVVYHRQGITGDYDGFDDPDALVHFILNGTQEAQP